MDRYKSRANSEMSVLVFGMGAVGAVTTIALAGGLMSTTEKLEDAHKNERTSQLQNQDLREELGTQFNPITDMVVVANDKSFSFKTKTEQNIDQTCEGSYEIKNKHALPIGNIACTELVPAVDQ